MIFSTFSLNVTTDFLLGSFTSPNSSSEESAASLSLSIDWITMGLLIIGLFGIEEMSIRLVLTAGPGAGSTLTCSMGVSNIS